MSFNVVSRVAESESQSQGIGLFLDGVGIEFQRTLGDAVRVVFFIRLRFQKSNWIMFYIELLC